MLIPIHILRKMFTYHWGLDDTLGHLFFFFFATFWASLKLLPKVKENQNSDCSWSQIEFLNSNGSSDPPSTIDWVIYPPQNFPVPIHLLLRSCRETRSLAEKVRMFFPLSPEPYQSVWSIPQFENRQTLGPDPLRLGLGVDRVCLSSKILYRFDQRP